MSKGEFTVVFEGGSSKASQQQAAPSTAAKTSPSTPESSPLKGSTQGPFVSKAAHSELSGVRMTDEGIKTIIRQEGYRSTAYPDASGYSVGYGHYLGDGDQGKGTKISPQQGLNYLAQDIRKVEAQIAKRIKVPLTDTQFTALASFAYNAGAGSMDKGIAAKINAGNFEGAASQMRLYDKSRDKATGKLMKNDELVQRRAFETSLLLARK